jgi:hypothetical protein
MLEWFVDCIKDITNERKTFKIIFFLDFIHKWLQYWESVTNLKKKIEDDSCLNKELGTNLNKEDFNKMGYQ